MFVPRGAGVRCPDAASSCVMLGLGSSRRPSRAFSLISAPWGQELTSPGYCSGLTAPTPEAQVQSQAGELRFPKMFVMALKGIKGNTQKQKIKRDTKDEPQTSSKCKIRPKKKKKKKQRNTHTYIHTDNQNSSKKTKHKKVTW